MASQPRWSWNVICFSPKQVDLVLGFLLLLELLDARDAGREVDVSLPMLVHPTGILGHVPPFFGPWKDSHFATTGQTYQKQTPNDPGVSGVYYADRACLLTACETQTAGRENCRTWEFPGFEGCSTPGDGRQPEASEGSPL